MTDPRILARIERESGGAGLLEPLSERLAQSELSSLLIEVAARRSAKRAPRELLAQYASDRFVRPSRADARVLLRVERAALEALPTSYTPLVLSPLAPLGTCSVVATASQNKIVSTVRGTEVISDATNVLALESATRRLASRDGGPVRLAASARMTRAQALARPEHSAHFQLFVTTIAGRDPGGRRLQTEGLIEAITTQLTMLRALASEGFACARARVTLSPDEEHTRVARDAASTIGERFADVPIAVDGTRIAKSGYYRGLCFGVHVEHEGESFPIGDGGLTDWLAKLTSSRKERFLVGAMGTELLATLLAPRGRLVPPPA